MRLRQKRSILVVVVCIAGAAFLLARSFRRARPVIFPTRGTVRRVVDGDSFHLTNYAEVRMLELDAPEMRGANPELARRSREALIELIGWKVVRLEPGPRTRDRYGRFLAYVFVDDDDRAGEDMRETFVNAEIVRQGLARSRTWGPPGARWDDILAAEKEAREARRGMWGRDLLRPAP